MKKRLKKAVIAAAAIAALCCGGIALYAGDYYHADETAAMTIQQAELLKEDGVTAEITDNMIIFRPDEIKAGFIFYPGGKVEYTAYVPVAYQLAQNGVACIITEMPLNLAVMDIDTADKAYERIANVDKWYIGGHSLGGSMAASYLESTGTSFDGLILLASYSTANLSAKDIDVLSVYGSNDKVLNMKKYADNFKNLPDGTTEIIVDGGNHAQFGSYGVQDGDGEALIEAEQQWNITVNAILEFMEIQ
ncbi:MAG: hypothetical protein E7483_02095 [Ruminococcaceae bacterium]|nr:hypothetical protein [Oscillospiraceae bacterium]